MPAANAAEFAEIDELLVKVNNYTIIVFCFNGK